MAPPSAVVPLALDALALVLAVALVLMIVGVEGLRFVLNRGQTAGG